MHLELSCDQQRPHKHSFHVVIDVWIVSHRICKEFVSKGSRCLILSLPWSPYWLCNIDCTVQPFKTYHFISANKAPTKRIQSANWAATHPQVLKFIMFHPSISIRIRKSSIFHVSSVPDSLSFHYTGWMIGIPQFNQLTDYDIAPRRSWSVARRLP